MFIKNTKRFLLILALSIVAVPLAARPASVSAAEPAKCIIFNTGSNLLSSDDDQYDLVDCASSLLANSHNWQEGHYYKVDITPNNSPRITEIDETAYRQQADIIGGGAGNLPGSNGQIDLTGQCSDGTALNKDNCGIIAAVVLFSRVLSGLVGVVVIMMVIIGGIQYSTARGDSQAVMAARKRIGNAILALIVYLFSFALLQWLVPGGIF